MQVVEVIEEQQVAAAALDPRRSRLLALLAERPASAAALASELGLPRQQVRYHLTALEHHGLVHQIDERRHGGLVERIYEPSAAGYLVSPAAMGMAGADPRRVEDRMSAAYLLAVAGRAIRELASLRRGAVDAGKALPTLTLDAEIRFRSAAERAAFAEELTATVVSLAARYHDEDTPTGRWHRLVAFSHPRPTEERP